MNSYDGSICLKGSSSLTAPSLDLNSALLAAVDDIFRLRADALLFNIEWSLPSRSAFSDQKGSSDDFCVLGALNFWAGVLLEDVARCALVFLAAPSRRGVSNSDPSGIDTDDVDNSKLFISPLLLPPPPPPLPEAPFSSFSKPPPVAFLCLFLLSNKRFLLDSFSSDCLRSAADSFASFLDSEGCVGSSFTSLSAPPFASPLFVPPFDSDDMFFAAAGCFGSWTASAWPPQHKNPPLLLSFWAFLSKNIITLP